MNTTLVIVIGMLVLASVAPFIAIYAVSLARKGEHRRHMRLQRRLFWTCLSGVLLLELQIRVAGGSGSLVADGTYAGAVFFRPILVAHIVGAVLTYVAWGTQVFLASRRVRAQRELPGRFTQTHRALGLATIGGLFYTALTALAVFLMAFVL